MVTLEQMRLSNSKIGTALPPGLVAVFAGATSGIGEASLKQFTKLAVKPRIYFLGRSKESGNRICGELQKLNPGGEYNFISVDVSSLRAVDDVCRELKAKESAINLLFLSTGTFVTGKDSDEGLNYPVAVAFYARLRLIVNLLPLLQSATHLRRVLTVLAGTKEGRVDTTDFQGRRTSFFTPRARGHFTAMTTLALEAVAARRAAPDVSFVHCYPGFVKTNLGRDVTGAGAAVLRALFALVAFVVGPFVAVPLDECGERHVFLATSARFPPAAAAAGGAGGGGGDGVPLPAGVAVARAADGKTGGGVYSVDHHAESAPARVEALLNGMRKDGTAEKVWAHVEEEFVRITGVPAV